MRRHKKDNSSIGKLSSSKFDQYGLLKQPILCNKQVEAALPSITRIRPHQQYQIKPRKSARKIQRDNHSIIVLEDTAIENPLPRVRVSSSKIAQLRRVCQKNPEEQVFYVDGHQGKVSRCMGVQMDDYLASRVGKIYSPRSMLLETPGKIKHQNLSKMINFVKRGKSHTFLNFQEHDYIKNLQKKREIKVIDYGYRLSDSWSTSAFLNDKNSHRSSVEFPKEEQFIQGVLPICCQLAQKPVYLTNSSAYQVDVSLIDQGNVYAQSNLDEHFQQAKNISIQNLIDNQSYDSSTIQIKYHQNSSRIKQLLIEEEKSIKISFLFPDLLNKPLSTKISQIELHIKAKTILHEFIGNNPQLVSVKHFKNCILVSTKAEYLTNQQDRIALLWYFTGQFYLGGWWCSQEGEGFKHGMGIHSRPNKFIFYGEFRQNLRNGYGIEKRTKDIYIGEWFEDKSHGWGKLFTQNNLELNGQFECGEYKTPHRQK